jgi:hypothetical protein
MIIDFDSIQFDFGQKKYKRRWVGQWGSQPSD